MKNLPFILGVAVVGYFLYKKMQSPGAPVIPVMPGANAIPFKFQKPDEMLTARKIPAPSPSLTLSGTAFDKSEQIVF